MNGAADNALRLGDLAPRLYRFGLGLAGIGLGAGVIWAWLDGDVGADRFFRSYLVAFIFVLSFALGGLFFTLIQHLTHAGWSVTLRRLAEAMAGNLQWIWILFVPVLALMAFGGGDLLYHWAEHGVADPASDHYDPIIAGKAAFLNPGFWLVRAVFYLAVWAILARFFLRLSVAQDETGDPALTRRMERWAPIAMLLYALTQSLAIIDWGMSLEPHWFSTMYAVYFFAATCCGFGSLLILTVYYLYRNGRAREEITLEHNQDLGKFLFAFGIVFWAYIAYSQYMLIWYANIPEETGWYLTRRLGGWTGVSMLLLVGHFAVPFVLLVTKHTKRIRPVLAVIAAWTLLMHFVDVYWLIMPQVPAEQFHAAAKLAEVEALIANGEIDLGWRPHPIDLLCVVGLAGLFVIGTAYQLRRCSLIPIQDPRLHESLAFENM